MNNVSAEKRARDILSRMDIEDAQLFSSGTVVELANLISDYDALTALARDLLEEVRDYIDGRNDELLDRADKLLGTPDAGEQYGK